MLSNLENWGMAAEDGPWLVARSALWAFALHSAWRTPAITPNVPALPPWGRRSSFWRAVRRPTGGGRRHL